MFPSSFHRAVESRGGKTVFEMEVSILFSSSRTCLRGSWMGMVWLMFPSSFHRAVMNGSRNLFKDKATFPSSFHRAAICYLDGIGLRIRSFPFSFHRAGLWATNPKIQKLMFSILFSSSRLGSTIEYVNAGQTFSILFSSSSSKHIPIFYSEKENFPSSFHRAEAIVKWLLRLTYTIFHPLFIEQFFFDFEGVDGLPYIFHPLFIEQAMRKLSPQLSCMLCFPSSFHRAAELLL